MTSCEKCKWCKYAFSGYKVFKCKRDPNKTFNKPHLHGFFCKHYVKEVVVNDKIHER